VQTLLQPETVPAVEKEPVKRPSRRQALQERARSAVVAGLVLFVAWQAGFGALVEGWRPELRDPTFEIKYRQFVRLIWQQPQAPATVVFLGSSITGHGIKADMMDEALSAELGRPVVAYNLATNYAGPLTHLVYLKRLLRRGVRPDLVVLELSPLLYREGQAKRDVERLPPHVLEHADLCTLERFAGPARLHGDWWAAHLVPVHGHRLMVLNQAAQPLVPHQDRIELWADADDHGWRQRRIPAPEEHRYFLSEVEKLFRGNLANYQIDAGSVAALRELTELLAREKIPAVLVMMPMGPLLRSLEAPERTAPLTAEFQSLSQRYGFTLIDARDWCGEDRFIDSYHLHRGGAAEFTERLRREVIGPALQGAARKNAAAAPAAGAPDGPADFAGRADFSVGRKFGRNRMFAARDGAGQREMGERREPAPGRASINLKGRASNGWVPRRRESPAVRNRSLTDDPCYSVRRLTCSSSPSSSSSTGRCPGSGPASGCCSAPAFTSMLAGTTGWPA
jgi:hypothetical protein